MPQVLVIDDDVNSSMSVSQLLVSAGHAARTVSYGWHALEVLTHESIDLAVSEIRLPDMSGLDIVRAMRSRGSTIPFIMIGTGSFQDALAAIRLKVADFLEKPVAERDLVRTIEQALCVANESGRSHAAVGEADGQEAHAAARLARALMPILDSGADPRTICDWAHCAYASSGALKNWCSTAGIAPRRCLLFGRMLRAVIRSNGGRHKLENLLAVVDRRTLAGLLTIAGFSGERDFPRDVNEFLARQTLIRDPDVLRELRRALCRRDMPHFSEMASSPLEIMGHDS